MTQSSQKHFPLIFGNKFSYITFFYIFCILVYIYILYCVLTISTACNFINTHTDLQIHTKIFSTYTRVNYITENRIVYVCRNIKKEENSENVAPFVNTHMHFIYTCICDTQYCI